MTTTKHTATAPLSLAFTGMALETPGHQPVTVTWSTRGNTLYKPEMRVLSLVERAVLRAYCEHILEDLRAHETSQTDTAGG